MIPTHPAYRLMVDASEAHSLPRRFLSDLVNHDACVLDKMDHAEPFVWLLYRDGAHFTRSTSARIMAAFLESTDHGPAYLWDGCALRRMPRDCEALCEALHRAHHLWLYPPTAAPLSA